jgi:hypothetical protein
MLLDIALMLLTTFGVSRVLLNFLPVSVTAKSRVAFANIGSLFVIALLYGIAVITAQDIAAILLVGIPVAAACQALWYWRDISKLPSSEGSYTTAPRNSIDGEVDPFRGKIERWEALVRYDDEICATAVRYLPKNDLLIETTETIGPGGGSVPRDRTALPLQMLHSSSQCRLPRFRSASSIPSKTMSWILRFSRKAASRSAS